MNEKLNRIKMRETNQRQKERRKYECKIVRKWGNIKKEAKMRQRMKLYEMKIFANEGTRNKLKVQNKKQKKTL